MQNSQQIFKLHSEYQPTGDQPQAIEKLVKGFQEGNQCETLLGVTGSGKTFTMANVIAQLNKPTLIIAHNKTLAAQLYGEFKEFFPENAVEYFVSYYDYYQPEAYVPSSDTYIAKDSARNDEIDKLRLSATSALSERNDVIVVSSVSCIYGIGSPKDYMEMIISLRPGMEKDRDDVIRQLIDIQYDRNDMDFHRGTFRVRGDVLEIFPAEETDKAVRVEFFGDEIDRLVQIDTLTGEILCELNHIAIFPASHYVVPMDTILKATGEIEKDMEEQVKFFKHEGKLIEAQRIAHLGRRLSSAKTGGDTSAGRTWPFKANIPKISYVIRLFLGLRFLSGLFFLSLHLCLNGLHLVFLGFDIRILRTHHRLHQHLGNTLTECNCNNLTYCKGYKQVCISKHICHK